jgi:hypothetical protein
MFSVQSLIWDLNIEVPELFFYAYRTNLQELIMLCLCILFDVGIM